MAFRASELRLILGVQAYGTTNLARLRRDIAALGREASIANANQLRVQDQVVAKRAQVAASARRIADMESRLSAKRDAIDSRSLAAAERIAARRSALAQREMAAMNTLANRQVQIGKQRDRISAMGGSGMQRFAIQEAQMAHRRLGIENQIAGVDQRRVGLQAQSLRNRAGEIQALRRLATQAHIMAEGNEAMGERIYRQIVAHPTTLPKGATEGLQEAQLRYRAILKDAERIKMAQAQIPKQIAAMNQQLQIVAEQEKLIGMRRTEQAAAIGRANEMLNVQAGALSAIEERLAQIKIEEAAITRQEGLTNAERTRSLRALAAQAAAIDVEKLKLTELIAEEERLAGIRMKEAIARDAANQRMAKAQRVETAGRTVAHIGRTAQFGGLIGTAGFAAAASAAADFNSKAQLAGTQMRDVAGSWQQGTKRGQELEKQILSMMEVFPAGAGEMADSAYEIFSSMNLVRNGVVNVKKGYDLLAVANKVAVAGQVDLSEATSAMIVTLNNFDPELKNVGGTMNDVFSIVRFGQMRLSDFANAMVPLAPIAKTTGLGLKDVGAALATLTILFKSPQQAAQGLARAIELLQLEPFRKGLQELDVNVNDATGHMRPLHDVVTDIAKAFPEATTSQKAMVTVLTQISRASGLTKAGIQGTVQARRALAGLITSMGLYENILRNIQGDQHEFQDAFNAMKDTPGVQWAIFINQMKAFALTIGQAALPVMLEFGEWLVNAAHYIEHLIKTTDGAIIKWAAWGAAILLVGGTLTNMAGSLVALIANLRLATMSFGAMEGSAAKAGIATRLLAGSMQILAGIGIISIPIVLQLIKGGEPGLWDFFTGALSGAAGGAMIGGAIGGPIGAAAGAGIGAITVPVVLEVMPHLQGPKDPSKIKPVKAAWSQYLNMALDNDTVKKANKQFFGVEDYRIRSQEDFIKRWNANLKKYKVSAPGEDVAMGTKAAKAATKSTSLLDKYQEYVKQFTKAQLDAQNAYLDSLGKGEDKSTKAANAAKKNAQIVADAQKQMQQEVEQSVDKLGGVYDKFLEMNKSAFGEVFQGPVLSGFMGDIFSSINSLLLQFGDTIPVPIQIIQNDLDVQMKNFAKLREGYADLVKRGVPPEVVQQIQQMGMSGLPFIQGLLQATGPQFNKWLATMKKSHGDIVKATEIDFDAQLKQWQRYGSDIATKMIDGLSSDAAQATIKGGFEKYVMQVFGKTLKENMAKTIATNMQAALEEAAAANAATNKEKGMTKAQIKAAKAARDAALGAGTPQKSVVVTGDKAATAANRRYPGSGTITHPHAMPATFAGYVASLPSAKGSQPIVNNHGDTINIRTVPMSPADMLRAMNKGRFQTRNKKRG